MVLPFITAISVDVFKTVPPVLKEAAYGVGCTTWEVVRNVVIPYTRVGVIGGIMLALGRALGETMAVTFIIGNSFKIQSSIFAPGTTISAAIASEFAESDGPAPVRPDPARPAAVRADVLRSRCRAG
jgi:phosphate transport system permease protein